MKLTRDQLAFKALCVLQEVSEALSRRTTVEPTAQLRFLLAYLHQISGPPERGEPSREVFDTFWRRTTQLGQPSSNLHRDQLGRRNDVETCVTVIARRIGLPLDIDINAAVGRVLHGRSPHTTAEWDERWRQTMARLAGLRPDDE